MRWDFTVPGEPRGKGRPRFSRQSGRAYTPRETEVYENLVGLTFRQAYPDQKPVVGNLELWINAYYGIPQSWSMKKQKASVGKYCRKKPDGDNIIKAICDGLNGVAYLDDTQIVEIHIVRCYSIYGHVDVSLTEVHEDT